VALWISLLRAVGLGVLVAAPVGAISMLCIQRTLARGRMAGYATGSVSRPPTERTRRSRRTD
jgi:putative LysE/RhtB family amino acid efflux pump